MLPAFVIGLREGLETVVIIGAIAVFLRIQGRVDLLRRVWRMCAVAAGICVGIALLVRFVEVNLPWRQQEQLEAIIGLAAVCTVTYMVVWMRRFPKDLQRDSSAQAASALARDSGRALLVLAFFAVLREGFEIAVFVIATIGLTGSSAWLATAGAFLGVVLALVVGIGVVRGSRHIDVARFFRVTALVLVLSAAGIAMSTVHTANAAGWITFGQTPQFDLSWLAPPGSVLSSITTGMFGLQPYPVIIEVLVWFVYFIPMTAVVLWPRRRVAQATAVSATEVLGPVPVEASVLGPPIPMQPHPKRAILHDRKLQVVGLLVLCSAVVVLGIVLASQGGPSKANSASAKPRVLFATLDDASCPSKDRCFAVGQFLPVDKDAAFGDPDGDGRAPHTLTEISDGVGWHLLASPDKGRGGAVLSGVSCPTVKDCVAVGYYRPDKFALKATLAPPVFPLVESYNGDAWEIEKNPTAAPNSTLVSVSCPAVKHCVAVGYTTTSSNAGESLESLFIESFDGNTWSVVPTAPLAGMSSGLSAVSCPSTSNCVAVGNVAPRNDPAATRPLIEVLEDGHWRRVLPSTMSGGPGILYDVACTAVNRCMAVGSTEALHSSGSALVLAWSGSTWNPNVTALSQKGDISLMTVACTTETNCIVGGTSSPSLDASPVKFLARVNETSWQKLGVSVKSANIEDVTCLDTALCLLVGSVPRNVFGNTTTLIAWLSDGVWVQEPSPIP